MKIVWVSDVKKVAYELPGPFAKVEAPQADNDSSIPPEIFDKYVFPTKSFVWNILRNCLKIFN